MSIRTRFAKWLMRGVAMDAVRSPEPEAEGGMKISQAALWEASRTGQAVPQASQIFARPKPYPGVLPAGLAMDSAGLPSCLPGVGGLATWAMQGLFHEGLAFLGFPYLAELSQRAEYRHIASIWAEHATRKGWELKGDEEKVGKLNDFLTEIGALAAFREATTHDAFFGRAQIFLDFDDFDRDDELTKPLIMDAGKISKKRPLKRLKVVEPMWSYPGVYESTNPLAPNYYKPDAWYIFGKTVSDTRMLTFVGNEVPDILKPAYAFGGMSMTQLVKPYVDNWLRTRQSVSDMINSFSVIVFKTNMENVMTGDCGDDVFMRVDLMNKMRSNRGAWAIDKNSEEVESVAVPLSGLDALQSQSQEQMASAARIPLSILLQVTPTGLNASSEGETRSFYADVNAYQEKVYRPNLKRLIDIAQLTLWDEIDSGITFIFPPLWEMTEKERAEINKLEAETDSIYVAGGIVSPEEARERIQEDEASLYHGVDLSGEPPILDDGASNDNDQTADDEPAAAE
jgi:hypothetical protein